MTNYNGYNIGYDRTPEGIKEEANRSRAIAGAKEAAQKELRTLPANPFVRPNTLTTDNPGRKAKPVPADTHTSETRLFEKIQRIEEQRTMGAEEEMLTPKEFLLYLMLHRKNDDGQIVPISKNDLSNKVNGRGGFISEFLTKDEYVNFPKQLAYQLAAMTKQEPGFFYKTAYRLNDTINVNIDMNVNITHLDAIMYRGGGSKSM